MKKSKWSVVLPSLHPNIDRYFEDGCFVPAKEHEKESFIETKESVTYWQEAWSGSRQIKSRWFLWPSLH
jgi:hypothetical protein